MKVPPLSSYEAHILSILAKAKIPFSREKQFSDLKGGRLRFDFWLPNEKIAIEVQGELHYHPSFGRRTYLRQKENDRRKKSYCLANNIKLYCLPYWRIFDLKTPSDIFSDEFLVRSKWHDDKAFREYKASKRIKGS